MIRTENPLREEVVARCTNVEERMGRPHHLSLLLRNGILVVGMVRSRWPDAFINHSSVP